MKYRILDRRSLYACQRGQCSIVIYIIIMSCLLCGVPIYLCKLWLFASNLSVDNNFGKAQALGAKTFGKCVF